MYVLNGLAHAHSWLSAMEHDKLIYGITRKRLNEAQHPIFSFDRKKIKTPALAARVVDSLVKVQGKMKLICIIFITGVGGEIYAQVFDVSRIAHGVRAAHLIWPNWGSLPKIRIDVFSLSLSGRRSVTETRPRWDGNVASALVLALSSIFFEPSFFLLKTTSQPNQQSPIEMTTTTTCHIDIDTKFSNLQMRPDLFQNQHFSCGSRKVNRKILPEIPYFSLCSQRLAPATPAVFSPSTNFTFC